MIDSFELDQICFNALKNSGVRGSDKTGPLVSSLARRKPADFCGFYGVYELSNTDFFGWHIIFWIFTK